MKLAGIMWCVAGLFWIIGSVIYFRINDRGMGVMFLCVGLMNVAVGIANS